MSGYKDITEYYLLRSAAYEWSAHALESALPELDLDLPEEQHNQVHTGVLMIAAGMRGSAAQLMAASERAREAQEVRLPKADMLRGASCEYLLNWIRRLVQDEWDTKIIDELERRVMGMIDMLDEVFTKAD